MSPVDLQAGTVTGIIFALGSYEKFQREIRETKQTWRNTKL